MLLSSEQSHVNLKCKFYIAKTTSKSLIAKDFECLFKEAETISLLSEQARSFKVVSWLTLGRLSSAASPKGAQV